MVTQAVASLLASANRYLKKAVQAREDFYAGREYEVAQHPSDPISAKVAYTNSVVGKTQIADNKWHMEQAQTFSLAAMGEAMMLMLEEQRRTNDILDSIHDSLKEMKVY